MREIEALEKRLWNAADQLRANSGLGSNEYFLPVMGLIFLRHAHNRFLKVKDEVEKELPKRGGVPRPLKPEDFSKKSALYLRDIARWDHLMNLPSEKDPGTALNEAMEAIEQDYPKLLEGTLPKDYAKLDPDLVRGILRVFNDSALNTTDGDVFGRIYEFFLMKFAALKAHDDGEFFTPVSIVQTIVNVIEPNHGKVFDPACGSGGMFVQTSHFLEKIGKPTHDLVTFYGQEKNGTTIRFANMNLAVHGLEGRIAEGITYYVDHHEMLHKADFVMANPPFNVDEIDAEKIKGDPRLPFGLPGVNKSKKVQNGNYVWISYFHSYLNAKGRSGFVMSSQASSAGNKEKEVRRKIVETGDVDVIISIRNNFFYTRAVPCELWFFDKGKPKAMRDKVLMIDARNVFRKVTRKINDFSPEQLKNLTAIVWLYRGESQRYLELIADYLKEIADHSSQVDSKLESYEAALTPLTAKLEASARGLAKSSIQVDSEKKGAFAGTLREIVETQKACAKDKAKLLKSLSTWISAIRRKSSANNSAQIKTAEAFEPIADTMRGLIKCIEHIYKLTARSADMLEKDFNGNGIELWNRRESKKLKEELEQARNGMVDQLKQALYFHRQIHWLQSRFPDAKLADVEGLVKLVDRKTIEKSDWSLTPGRYVGVAVPDLDDEFDFQLELQSLERELLDLDLESKRLSEAVLNNLREIVD